MKHLLTTILLFGLIACATESPPNHYYLLTPTGEGHAQSTVTLSQVRIPAYLDRAQIVRLRGSELAINEFERWGESLDGMIRRVLAADLAAQPAAGAPRAARVVIDDFVASENGDVTLTAHWNFMHGNGKEAKPHSFSDKMQSEGSDNAALAAAMSDLLNRLAASIAASN